MGAAEQDWLLDACGGSVRDFYDTIGVDLPATGLAEVGVRCFANPGAHSHEDRRPSCSVNLTSGLWHCKGCGESGNPYRAALVRGYSERSARELACRHGLFMESVKEPKKAKATLPGERKLKAWRHALRENPVLLRRLVERRGWLPSAVARLGIGWDGERLTFPIRSQKHKIVGVVRYLPGGNPKSLAVPGSKRDLFPAPELIRRHHPLFVVEGEPDAVAVWSLGFKVVAVPGAGSWRPEWASRLMGRRLVVLTDCDAQGRSLAAKIADAVPNARVVDLESGRDDGYDVGDMVWEASQEGGLGQLSRVLRGLVA